jgi:hypothetical protein
VFTCIYIFVRVDIWVRLQERMVSSIPGFKRSTLAYKHKFNTNIERTRLQIIFQEIIVMIANSTRI